MSVFRHLEICYIEEHKSIFCFHTETLRNFAPLREKKICSCVLMSKKITFTDWHRVYSASLLIFSQQQITQNSVLQSHRVICIITLINKYCLRKSALSAWDKYVPHGSVGSVCCFPLTNSYSDFQFCVRPFSPPQGISVNSCSLVALKNTCRYAPIRGEFSVDSVASVWNKKSLRLL